MGNVIDSSCVCGTGKAGASPCGCSWPWLPGNMLFQVRMIKWIMARGIRYHHCWKPSSWAMQIKSPGAGSLAGSLCLSELSLLTVLNTGIPSTENSRSQDKMITNLRFCFKKLLDNNTSYMPDTGPSSSFVTIYVMCPGSMISTISSFPF